MTFIRWREAHAFAIERATKTNLDIAIRKIGFARNVRYVVSFASRNDSDYHKAQIVRPGQSI